MGTLYTIGETPGNATYGRRNNAGVWSTLPTPTDANHGPILVVAPNGDHHVFAGQSLYESVNGGGWTFLGSPPYSNGYWHGIDKDELWVPRGFGGTQVIQWERGSGFTTHNIGVTQPERLWVFAPDNVVVIAQNGTVHKYNGVSFSQIGSSGLTSLGNGFMFSPDGQYLFAGGFGNLAYSPDQGVTWNAISLASMTGSQGDVAGMGGSSASDMWVGFTRNSVGADDLAHVNVGTVDASYNRNSSGGGDNGIIGCWAFKPTEAYFTLMGSAGGGGVEKWDGVGFSAETTGLPATSFNFERQRIWGTEAELGPELTAITDPVVSTAGGDEVTITGVFPANEDLEVTINGVLAYGGQGFGYAPQSSDGLTLTVAAPPLAKGAHDVNVKIVSTGFDTTMAGALTVVERPWPSKHSSTRASLPPWVGAGRRALTDEPEE